MLKLFEANDISAMSFIEFVQLRTMARKKLVNDAQIAAGLNTTS
jgi:hypothetical protein